MNVFTIFNDRVQAAIATLAPDIAPEDLARITCSPPRDPAHGDMASNAAMVLAKPLKANPRDFAGKLAAILGQDPDIQSAEVAGPGFINLRLAPAYWTGLLHDLLKAPERFSHLTIGSGRKVNVEYVSANPTGPMHVGHCRGAVVGDALASLLAAAGFDVTREYYINDAGGQIDVLARSAFLRYREALGEDIGEIPEGLYPGDYLVPVGERLASEHGTELLNLDEEEMFAIVKPVVIDMMMDMIRDDLLTLGIRHDVFFSERTLHDRSSGESQIDEMLKELRERDLVYDGSLPPPKGQLPEDWEDREQTLFRAADYGDDSDRPLVKSDGSYTYFAADVAYFRSKFQRGFEQMIFVLGADHGGYVKRLEAVGEAISGGKAKVIVRLCQLVKLMRNGEPVKMSKRSGDFVTLRDVVDEVGRDAVRFMMLMRKNDAPLDFDFAQVKEQSKDNAVFYVQYAHARVKSVLRQAAEHVPELAAVDPLEAPLHLLADESEVALIKRLAELPRVIEGAAEAHEPHRIAFYLSELAADFHGHWNKGKERTELRFINHEHPDLTKARLAFVHAIGLVLAGGLAILGVSAPDEMR
ncbi:Arginine-tRNA ligase [Hartmannibacter diazotrophicus]|uniref:Arginine--tRNA ligase n=1 Tax=Hartmannibacter diazotrophicus TaxID=1482074 RepID=A0A2C9D6L5_9HYPH|nr:arginine--tRNA ligase [Hartmannibacter diazotrophicus]SON55947.1 Arginine-tRNA ligase [Hartmannibacter diazotrophicus]